MAYATSDELEAYTGQSAPAGAERLLERASEFLDEVTLGKIGTWFADPPQVVATDYQLAQAKNAVCAQVEYWMSAGEESDVQSGDVKSYTIGNVSVSKDTTYGTGGLSATMAPRARRHLFLAGLLYQGVDYA